jgi:hypothetical protein
MGDGGAGMNALLRHDPSMSTGHDNSNPLPPPTSLLDATHPHPHHAMVMLLDPPHPAPQPQHDGASGATATPGQAHEPDATPGGSGGARVSLATGKPRT